VNGNKRTLHSNTQQPSGGGKNAYELRTELLNLAYTICYNQHVSDDILRIQNQEDDSEFNGLPSTSPTTAEVVECASQLNDFISQKTGGDRY